MSSVTLLKYSNTNTYLIEGEKGSILFDTGWAGTFNEFCRALGETGKRLQDISYILISHFHPDHMGIAQEIADKGPVIVIPSLQKEFVHYPDIIFAKDSRVRYEPVEDEKLKIIDIDESRAFLESVGISGEIFHTPGHSDDSISLWLDEGKLFVGDLNPLYELEMHRGTEIERSWNMLLKLCPEEVYYGHAKTAVLGRASGGAEAADVKSVQNRTAGINKNDMYSLVSQIIRYIDKGYSLEKIRRKTGADAVFIEDVSRMYLTHQNVSVQGIMDRIEIKNR